MLFVNMVYETARAVGHEATVPTSSLCFVVPALLNLFTGEFFCASHRSYLAKENGRHKPKTVLEYIFRAGLLAWV